MAPNGTHLAGALHGPTDLPATATFSEALTMVAPALRLFPAPVLTALSAAVLTAGASAQVQVAHKISSVATTDLMPADDSIFGISNAWLGDINGDGLPELATVANYTPTSTASITIVTFNPTLGTSAVLNTITPANLMAGGCSLPDPPHYPFAQSLCRLPDLDGNGVPELALGSLYDDDVSGGVICPSQCDEGAVWIVFLNSDGSLLQTGKLSDVTPGMAGLLNHGEAFGQSIELLPDLNMDGRLDIIVGSAYYGIDQDNVADRKGSISILSIDAPACPTPPACSCPSMLSVQHFERITAVDIQTTPEIAGGDVFGEDVAYLGDIDSDGDFEVAVSAVWYSDCGFQHGAIWILSLMVDPSGHIVLDTSSVPPRITFDACHGLPANDGGMPFGAFEDNLGFGHSICSLGDLDGDGTVEMAIGSPSVNGASGAIWFVSLRSSGEVRDFRRIDACSALPSLIDCTPVPAGLLQLDPIDQLGLGLDALDLDGNGKADLLAAGAPKDDDGCSCMGGVIADCNKGAVWVLEPELDGSLFRFPDCMSLADGVVQSLRAVAPGHASELYLLPTTTTGTSPGLPAGGTLVLPLNFSDLLLFTILNPNLLVVKSLDFLNGDGEMTATMTLAAGLDPGLAGVTLHHAYMLLELVNFTATFVSNPALLTLIP